MKIIINGTEYYFDVDACKKEELFLQYKSDLLDLVGIGTPAQIVSEAKEYLIGKHPEYAEFI